MKTLKFLGPVLLLALNLAGCATSPISRIDSNRAKYESWPIEVQEAVLAGEARKGMTQEQVEMAKGKPSEVVPRGGDEIWVYKKGGGMGGVGSGLLNNTGVSVGTGIGGVGVSTGTTLGRNRRTGEEDEEIVFTNGVVTRGDSGR